LGGSFAIEDMKLLPTLPSLTKFIIDGHVYKDKHALTLHGFIKLEPTFLRPLLEITSLTHLALPVIDDKFVSLFASRSPSNPNNVEPSSLAANLLSLEVKRVHMVESDLDHLLASCSRLQRLVISELRLFNPRLMNPFANFSQHLQHVSIAFPRDDDLVPQDLEIHLISSLAQLPSLTSVELERFACRPAVLSQYPRILPKVSAVTFRCERSSDFVRIIPVVEALVGLVTLTVCFPEVLTPEFGLDDDFILRHAITSFNCTAKCLRIRGEPPSRVLKSLAQARPMTTSLEVELSPLGHALRSWPPLVVPMLENLQELIMQVETKWHEDLVKEVLWWTSSLRSLHVYLARGARSIDNTPIDINAGDLNVIASMAQGSTTFTSVFDFIIQSNTMERLEFTIARPLPYQQISEQKLTIEMIKETLIQLKSTKSVNSPLESVLVSVAVINSMPWKLQVTRDCLGRWAHHF